MQLVWLTSCVILFVGARAATRCCTDADHGAALGCFSDTGIWDTWELPECPCTLGSCPSGSQEYPHFDLYTRSNQNNRQTFTRFSTPPGFNFVGSKQTIFLIHGWMSSRDTVWLIDMKDEILNNGGDYNVVVVGWQDGAGRVDYMQSAATTRTTGAEVDEVAKMLVSSHGAAHSRMWCAGHSLGAHTCGHAGHGTSFDRITGMDPAGPKFEGSNLDCGLNTNCASFVDVLHTDAKDTINRYGTLRDIGHLDFYPNGAQMQPGCNDYLDDTSVEEYGFLGCSHGRSAEYFHESINTDCFACRQRCTDYNNLPGSCTACGGVCARMGWHSRGSGSNGIYYMETNDQTPFCQN